MTKKQLGLIRNRVKELRMVRAGDLIPNPGNWRVHGAFQREAMEGVLREVGQADALLAYETPKGLMLIDGHLRAELMPDQQVPVLILDVTEDEAKIILATFDPLSALASDASDKLRALLDGLGSRDGALGTLLQELAQREGLDAEARMAAWSGMPAYEHADLEPWKQVIVNFKSPEDYEDFQRRIDQKLTPDTRSIWHPKAPVGTTPDKRYVGAT